MNQIREVERINQEELARGISGTSASWHAKYARSAWVFVGNLAYELTEGDVLAVMSEYGEIDDFHLVRDEDTGKSKGFCFCKYCDARSCVLAVDNLCGFQMNQGRSLRVDHVESYRLPKSLQDKEEELQKRLQENEGLEGHAYEGVELKNDFSFHQGQDLFAPKASKRKKSTEEEDPNRPEGRKSKEEQKREKERRKRERAQIRQEREERRREKRAKHMKDGDEAEDRSKGERHRSSSSSRKHKKSSRKDDKKKRKKSERRSRSRSRSPPSRKR
ncbi:U2 snRNP component IST3 [Seminavis robusta]|uniref:U2 snRNP component IST3 n=1 Tax=Seminavis robusta TaxID=568900 RepID=A0A9N8HXX6_9STRA|nr:U2 snRNP component IST3 [Seminavis robusta]|eukprot:Sro1891_g303780.1 U2 snRNP component IST3 (274) ;mRNA; r:10119-10940